MTDKIYVVMGMTGGWGENYTNWPVMAYLNEQAAVEHAAKAGARAREIYPHWRQAEGGMWENYLSAENEYDPHMEKDGDVLYLVHPVDIADSYAGTNQPNEGITQEN